MEASNTGAEAMEANNTGVVAMEVNNTGVVAMEANNTGVMAMEIMILGEKVKSGGTISGFQLTNTGEAATVEIGGTIG